MKKKYPIFITLCAQWTLSVCTNVDFLTLLKCNLQQRDIAQECNPMHELFLYNQHVQNESNYIPLQGLEEWIQPAYEDYPKIHQFNQTILDTLADLPIHSICEVGAGSGKICKYLYARDPSLDITCVENSSVHIEHIIDNFERRTDVIAPDIHVKATIVKGGLPHITALSSNSFDAVFTSTVFMHLPFVVAVEAAQEMVRITKRYILHVENKNDGREWYNMTIILPSDMSRANLIGIDYPKLYESLGVKTLVYKEFRDNASPATFIVYLGEKI